MTTATPPYLVALTVRGRRCAIVGGGAVAERKARGLLASGAAVTVIAPTLTPGLRALAAEGALAIVERLYAPGDLTGAFLAFAATNDRAVNAAVAAEGRGAGAPVNVADAPDDGDFTLPAVARRGNLTIGVSTSGGSPALATLVRDRLAETLTDADVRLLDLVAALRQEALASVQPVVIGAWRAALTPDVVALAQAGDLTAVEARLRAALRVAQTEAALAGGTAR